jgi:N-methylhydantoinase A/oxoprolinase/acetone carboxylase beta subunit
MKIGIDIGGTHTDGVIVDETGKLLHSVKVATTHPLEKGFIACLKTLLSNGVQKKEIKTIVVGSTHAMNALLEGKRLAKVGLIRLAGQKTELFPPTYDWPSSLIEKVLAGYEQVNGGYECDGRTITPLNKQEVTAAAEKLLQKGAVSFVVQGAFSPVYPHQEWEVGELLQALYPEIPLTLSHQLGGMGFLERENGALLNGALIPLMKEGFDRLAQSVSSLGLETKIFLTQNQGSRVTIAEALRFPIKTLSAGPTNSFIGAARLEGLHDAVVVDIGGTSTDVGVVKQGFPRKQLQGASIAGIPLGYQMPDVISISLGGGSLLKKSSSVYQFTGESCARELRQRALSFGGDELTLTDVAISHGHLTIEGAMPLNIDGAAAPLLRAAFEKVQKLIERAKGPDLSLPVLFVGGGALLFPRDWLSENTLIPASCGVANAYGAALAEVSATLEITFALSEKEKAMEALHEKGKKEVERLGGNALQARLVDMQVVPYHYMPGGKARGVITMAAPPK